MRILKAAAKALLGDIRSQVYDSTVFSPSDNFLEDVETVMTNKKASAETWKKKCVAIAHSPITAVRPRSFSFCSGMESVFAKNSVQNSYIIDLLHSLGSCSAYTETLQLEKPVIEEGGFVQFIFDNGDLNFNNLDGLGTLHAMGCIMTLALHHAVAPDTKVSRVKKCSAADVLERAGSIQLQVYRKEGNTELQTITIADVDSVRPILEDTTPSVCVLWLYGKCSDTLRMSPLLS